MDRKMKWRPSGKRICMWELTREKETFNFMESQSLRTKVICREMLIELMAIELGIEDAKNIEFKRVHKIGKSNRN